MMGSVDLPADQTLYYQRKFEMLGKALRALPEKQRRAILLRKYFGMSHHEIARKMKVSVSSVEKYIASGIKECKRVLTVQGYE
jgi:RNA polymerase sigma-70 factor (ECF subfamily)